MEPYIPGMAAATAAGRVSPHLHPSLHPTPCVCAPTTWFHDQGQYLLAQRKPALCRQACSPPAADCTKHNHTQLHVVGCAPQGTTHTPAPAAPHMAGALIAMTQRNTARGGGKRCPPRANLSLQPGLCGCCIKHLPECSALCYRQGRW